MGSAGVSESIDLVVVNDVDDTQVKEVRNIRQQEVISKTKDSGDSTISEQFVSTMMGQDGIHQSTITRHSPPSYTAELSNKS